MTTGITVPASLIAAALHFCGTGKDGRRYLMGVHVDSNGWLSATDGIIAFMARYDGPRAEKPFTVSSLDLKALLAGKPDKLTLSAAMADTPVWDSQGTFPDVSRVIPSEVSGEYVQFNPDFIARIGKAAKALGNNSMFHLFPNGTGPAGVRFYGRNDCLGVIMPYRSAYGANDWKGMKL